MAAGGRAWAAAAWGLGGAAGAYLVLCGDFGERAHVFSGLRPRVRALLTRALGPGEG